jgi:hypothetical protein
MAGFLSFFFLQGDCVLRVMQDELVALGLLLRLE